MRRLILLAAFAALALSAVAPAATSRKTSGTAWVGVTHNEGEDVYVSGDFKDKVLGRGALVYVVNAGSPEESGAIPITAKRITLYTRKGSLSGTGKAVQHVPGNEVTDGTFNLTKGTGRFKGHTFKGTFSGTFADGVYTYTYAATYR